MDQALWIESLKREVRTWQHHSDDLVRVAGDMKHLLYRMLREHGSACECRMCKEAVQAISAYNKLIGEREICQS